MSDAGEGLLVGVKLPVFVAYSTKCAVHTGSICMCTKVAPFFFTGLRKQDALVI